MCDLIIDNSKELILAKVDKSIKMALKTGFIFDISKNEDVEIENFKKNGRISSFLKLMFETNDQWQNKRMFSKESLVSTNGSDFRTYYDDLWSCHDFLDCFNEKFDSNDFFDLKDKYYKSILEFENLGYELMNMFKNWVICKNTKTERYNILNIENGSFIFENDAYIEKTRTFIETFFDIVDIDEERTIIFWEPRKFLIVNNQGIEKSIETLNTDITKHLFDKERNLILAVDIYDKKIKQYNLDGKHEYVYRLEMNEDMLINQELLNIFLWKNNYIIVLTKVYNKKDINVYVIERKTIYNNMYYDLLTKEVIDCESKGMIIEDIKKTFIIGNYIFVSVNNETIPISISRLLYDSLINTKITMLNDFMNFKAHPFDEMIKRDMELTPEEKRIFVLSKDEYNYIPRFLIIKDERLFNFFEIKNGDKKHITFKNDYGSFEMDLFLKLINGDNDICFSKRRYDLDKFKGLCDIFEYGDLMKVLFDLVVVSWKYKSETKIKLEFLLKYHSLMKHDMNVFDKMILKSVLKNKMKISMIEDKKIIGELSSLFFQE